MDLREERVDGLYHMIEHDMLHTDTQEITTLVKYIYEKEGKLVRPQLMRAVYHVCKGRTEDARVERWAGVLEMLHVSSLVHDDIIDNASQRRGVPCVHLVHGLRQSVFTANYMVGRAGRVLASLGDLRLF